MFFVELKPVPNNKDIFNVEYIQQCKIKFEPTKQKKDIAQCANCTIYGNTKNYCHFKPRHVKCTGDNKPLPPKRKIVKSNVSSVVEIIL
jgi:hypothetical protein